MSRYHFPPPKDWQEFERLCCTLWRIIWKAPNTKRYGRSGQSQEGIDVYGRPNNGADYSGIQCKAKSPDLSEPKNTPANSVTKTELLTEITKTQKFNKGKLTEFILVHTGPKDTEIEKYVMELNTQNTYGFTIEVFAWEDIESLLALHPDVLVHHYKDLVESLLCVVKKSNGIKLELLLNDTKVELEELRRQIGGPFEPLFSIPNMDFPEFYRQDLDANIAYDFDKLCRSINDFPLLPIPLDKDIEGRKHNLFLILRSLNDLIKKL